MRLLVFTEYFPSSSHAEITGGVEARTFHLLSALAKKHEITLLCSYQGQQRAGIVNEIVVLRAGLASSYSNSGNVFLRLNFVVAAFVKALLLPKPDLIECTSYLTYLPAALAGLLRNIPVVATYHESWSLREWLWLKGWWTGMFGWLWTRAARLIRFDSYIAVSGVTKQRLVQQGIPEGKITVVHNGVEFMHAQQIRAQPYREPSIMCTARLIKSKRVDVLIRAAALLTREFRNLHVTIHGKGSEREALETLAQSLGVQKNVVFTGFIKKFDDVLMLRKRHKLFCLPAEIEGFGMVVIEAMACGIPVVCTDIPVLAEVTGDGKGSLLFKNGSAEDLAAKIKQLLTNAELYRRKKREALMHAQLFDWKRLAKEVERVYAQCARS